MRIDILKTAAPAAAAGSVVAAVAAVLLAGWNVGECIRFQTARDECDATLEQAVPTLVAGIAAISGTMGGFWTYNDQLRKGSRSRDDRGRFVPEE